MDYTKTFDPMDKDAKALEKCVLARIEAYKDLHDEDLWHVFREEFEAWTEEILKPIHTPSLIKLRDALRTNGVFVRKEGQQAAKALHDVISQSEAHIWTEADVTYHIRHRGSFNSPSMEINHGMLIQSLQTMAVQPPHQSTRFEQPDTPSPLAANLPGHAMTLRSHLNQARETTPIPPPDRQWQEPITPGMNTTYVQTAPPTTPGQRETEITYAEQRSIPIAAGISYLRKAYTEAMKYGGYDDDAFDLTYNIFLELCSQNGLHTAEARTQAFAVMLKDYALTHYIQWKEEWNRTGIHPAAGIKAYFENEEHLRAAQSKWDSTELKYVIRKNPEKSLPECLELMLRDLQKLYHKLRPQLRNEVNYHAKLISTTRTIPACQAATGKPAATVAGVIQDLRASVNQYTDTQLDAQNMPSSHPVDAYYTDRRYHGRQSRSPYRERQPSRNRYASRYASRSPRRPPRDRSPRKCYICNKEGCWSTNHTAEEREAARQRAHRRIDQHFAEPNYREDDDEDFEAWFIERDKPSTYNIQDDVAKSVQPTTQYFTIATPEHSEFAPSLAKDLANRSAEHYITCLLSPGQIPNEPPDEHEETTTKTANMTVQSPIIPEYSFLTESRYSSNTFVGILVDSGAAEVSTAGYGQYLAYRKIAKGITIDQSTAGAANIRFGAGDPIQSIGSIDVETPIGTVRFHVVETMTPFLLSLKDMDRLKIYFDNTRNLLINRETEATAPIVRRFGHPFLIWDLSLVSFLTESFERDACFLTDTELRRLHRRFGHPSVERLRKLLTRAGHDINTEALAQISKFCHHCQIHGKSPGRFRFTLRDDVNFNHSIIVDIMYINGKPVLHIVDEATRFNAAHWLDNISAKHTWDVLRMIWFDTYLGPPDFVVTDAGKNFTSKEFNQHAALLGTIITTIPVEAHWSIGAVERYHAVLRRAYEIVNAEIPDIDANIALQMAVKAVNDTAGPDGLVPTLLVFGAYPRMTQYDPPAPTIAQRSEAIKKAMTEVRKLRAKRQINNAINTRNGPSSTPVHSLPIDSDVLVWREGKTGYAGKWTGPYKLLAVNGETCIIELPRGPTEFRSTVVKPYQSNDQNNNQNNSPNDDRNANQNADQNGSLNDSPGKDILEGNPEVDLIPPAPKVVIPPFKPNTDELPLQRPQREHRLPSRYREDFVQAKNRTPETFAQAPVVIPSSQYEESRRTEINGLLERGVFVPVDEKDIPPGTRIYTFRFVDEVKNRGTDKAYEKSRLVVQAYNDREKTLVLTQSPTIQRSSQRIILSIGSSKNDAQFYIRDITQAYIQSTTYLNRDFYIRIPPDLAHFFPGARFLKIVRPLYGIPEAGNHWYRTYHGHHTKKLGMETSTYDPCLLHCSNPDRGFGIVGMQTDDTLIVADSAFAVREEEEIKRANILCKPREQLTSGKSLKFNGAVITEDPQGVILTQERTCTKMSRPTRSH
jgi:hypothetical protein